MPMLLSEVQAEVQSWANSLNGRYLDFDGGYGAQCVDFSNRVAMDAAQRSCSAKRASSEDAVTGAIAASSATAALAAAVNLRSYSELVASV